MQKMMTELTENGKTFNFDDSKAVLSNEQLNFLCQFAHNTGHVDYSFLGKAQKTQLLQHAIRKAEGYSTTHSMRYSIMRDVTAALFPIYTFVKVVKYDKDGYAVYLKKGNKVAKNPIFCCDDYNEMDKFCRENCYRYIPVENE